MDTDAPTPAPADMYIDSAFHKILSREIAAVVTTFSSMLPTRTLSTLNGHNYDNWRTHILAEADITCSSHCLTNDSPPPGSSLID